MIENLYEQEQVDNYGQLGGYGHAISDTDAAPSLIHI